MSFGFGVGDLLAVLNLVERITKEVDNLRQAPAHFQQLQAELDLLRNTIRQVLKIEPTNEDEHADLQRIRALVTHCLPPLQAFIGKLQAKEPALGHFRTTRSLSSIGTRLHWSLVARNDVEDLRKTIVAAMVAINVLLGMQQLATLKRISFESNRQSKFQAEQSANYSELVLKRTSDIMNLVQDIPQHIADLRDFTNIQQAQQEKHIQRMNQNFSLLSIQLDSVHANANRALVVVQNASSRVQRSVLQLFALMVQVQKLLRQLMLCSGKVLEVVARNARMLLDLQSQMKRMIRAIDAIPLHLNLDIVRLDDALGESWALPFQACTNWFDLKNLLSVVVFGNGRIGARYISENRFAIISAKTGQVIPPFEWQRMVRSGTHVHQAMIVDRNQPKDDCCPYQFCSGQLEKQSNSATGRVCLTCGRWSTFEQRTSDIVRVHSNDQYPSVEAATKSSQISHPQKPMPSKSPTLPAMTDRSDELKMFRRVRFSEVVLPVESVEQATALLSIDPLDSRGNQYMGWLRLLEKDLDALDLLTLSVATNPTNSQTWYLLGRAYLQFPEVEDSALCAYEAFQQAVWCDGRCPDYWISVAVLYYRIRQERNSLDALTRCIRLNPFVWEAWYNCGVLYDSCINQKWDARDALRRCIELNPQFQHAIDRLAQLEQLSSHEDDESGEPYDGFMIQCPIEHTSSTTYNTTRDDNLDFNSIVIHPIRSPPESDNNDEEDDIDEDEDDVDMVSDESDSDWEIDRGSEESGQMAGSVALEQEADG